LIGHEDDQEEYKLDPAVIREEPQRDQDDPNKEIYKKPALWTWMRKQAENNVERSRILKNVFAIETIPDGYTNKHKQAWYDKRNAIAHGRKGVTMKLGEYIDVDVFVAKTMTHISDQCRYKLKLVL
jgi:hypothetical protein